MLKCSRKSLVAVLVLVSCGAVSPAVTHAQSGNAPPGNSGVDEYVEGVPSTSGDRPTAPDSGSTQPPTGSSQAAKGGTGRPAPPLTPSKRAALLEEGDDGAAAAKAIQATRKGDGRAAGSTASGSPEGPSGAAGETGDSGLSTVWGALSGSSGEGVGAFFPLVLIVTILLGIGVVARRRRSSS